jgi:hypothetical protein
MNDVSGLCRLFTFHGPWRVICVISCVNFKRELSGTQGKVHFYVSLQYALSVFSMNIALFSRNPVIIWFITE